MSGSIAVQGAIGEVGSKATTLISDFSFNSMAEINGVQLGASADGLFKLNTGADDDGTSFISTFTIATTDFGLHNHKQIRFLYFGVDTDSDFTVSVKADDKVWRDYTAEVSKTGMQEIRVPVGRDGYGRYWTIKISSTAFFRLDQIDIATYVLSAGRRG